MKIIHQTRQPLPPKGAAQAVQTSPPPVAYSNGSSCSYHNPVIHTTSSDSMSNKATHSDFATQATRATAPLSKSYAASKGGQRMLLACFLAGMFLLSGLSLQAQGCSDFSLSNVELVQAEKGKPNSGRMLIHIAGAKNGEVFSVAYQRGGKGVVSVVSGLAAVEGIVTLSGLRPGRYENIEVKRASDGCANTVTSSLSLEAEPGSGVQFLPETTCGNGSFDYTNCRGQSITIQRANISPNKWIFTGQGSVGTVSFVNSSCQIASCVQVYCVDPENDLPTPGSGYPYGSVSFTEVTGHTAAGMTELQAERINWISCNGSSQGYTTSQIQQAIWCIRGSSNACNNLSSAAITAVPNVQGGISSQMKFYKPNDSDVQVFVPIGCASPSCSVTVRLRGVQGSEHVNFRVNGDVVASHTLTTSFQNITYSGFNGTSFAVEFTNDNGPRDVHIEHIIVNGTTYLPVQGTHSSSCNSGGNLLCNGTLTWSSLSCSGGVTPPDSYAFGCEDGVVVDEYGSGANCAATHHSQVSVPDPSNVYQVIAEVVYKNQNPGNTITVTSSTGQSYTLNRVTVSGVSSNVYVFRGVISGNPSQIRHNTATGSCGNNSGLQSMVLYVFRNTAIKQASSLQLTGKSGYCNLVSFTIPIPTDVAPRNITLSLPISELTQDNRYLRVIATAGGVSNSTVIYGP